MKNFINILLILCVTTIVVVALKTADNKVSENKYSVSASGQVFAKANIANLIVGFQTEIQKTAVQAVEENSQKMNKIIKKLTALKINSADIKTTNYNLSPIYNWEKDKGQVLAGYQVSQRLTIKIRDLNKIGKVISQTTAQGANQIGNINFTIDDEDKLKAQARAQAILKAKQKAKEIAKLTGLKLGPIINVVTNQTQQPKYSNYSRTINFAAGSLESPESPQIEIGENEIKVQVTLVYQIK